MMARGALAFAAFLVACSDASRPAVSGDTGPLGESAGDAAVAAVAAEAGAPTPHTPGTWCAGRASLLCEDFDTPSFTSRSWTYTETTASGMGLPLGALDGATFLSAPSAFTARTPAISGSAGARQQLQAGLAGPDALHVDAELGFAVRIGGIGGAARVEIARIEGTNPITFAGFGVALLATSSGASLELVQGPSVITKPLQAAPRVGAWSRVALRLGLERTVTGPPTSVVVQIDDGPPETFALERGMGVRPFVRLGLVVLGPAAPCEVTYDDVTYDAR